MRLRNKNLYIHSFDRMGSILYSLLLSAFGHVLSLSDQSYVYRGYYFFTNWCIFKRLKYYFSYNIGPACNIHRCMILYSKKMIRYELLALLVKFININNLYFETAFHSFFMKLYNVRDEVPQ